jgi:hypothetical protein
VLEKSGREKLFNRAIFRERMLVFKYLGKRDFYRGKLVLGDELKRLKRQGALLERKDVYQAIYVSAEILANFYAKHIQKKEGGVFTVLVKNDTQDPSWQETETVFGIALQGTWDQKKGGMLRGDYYELDIPKNVGNDRYAARHYDANTRQFIDEPYRGVFRIDTVVDISPKNLPPGEKRLWDSFQETVLPVSKNVTHFTVA